MKFLRELWRKVVDFFKVPDKPLAIEEVTAQGSKKRIPRMITQSAMICVVDKQPFPYKRGAGQIQYFHSEVCRKLFRGGKRNRKWLAQHGYPTTLKEALGPKGV